MKQPVTNENKAATQSQLALHLMVSKLSVKTTPSNPSEKTIVNDVPSWLQVNTDQHKLAAIISRLLDKVIDHTDSSRIRICAKNYHNVTILHIKDKSRLNSPAFANSLVEVQELAEELRGSVSVTSYRNDVTTVALSFMNVAA